MKIIAYMDYDKKEHVIKEVIYFKRPTTRHTNPDIKTIKVEVKILKFYKGKNNDRRTPTKNY